MKAVGVKLLKNNLSRYLRAVREGEIIWVTDRDEVIAEIHRPVTPVPGKISRWDSWLNLEERAGRVRRAGRVGPSFESITTMPAPSRPMDLDQLLNETRQDRF